MRFLVHGYRVYGVLDSKVFELAVVIDVVLMKNGDGTAVARDVDALKPRIELDDIRSVCQRQKRNGDVLVQIEDGHQFVPFTGKERAVVDRKSTRLNSSHSQISYAVFCLKKKKK